MGIEFNLRVAGIAIQRGFRESFGQGIIQIENEVKNVLTRRQEVVSPLEAYFRTPLEIRTNKAGKTALFWKGYDQSISNSMLRNAALLKLNGAPKEEIDKAKTEWKMWNRLEEKILGLKDGEAIQFLALKGIEAERGVALQQISWQDGQLVLESQLLPFNQVDEIDGFRDLIGKGGEDISLASDDGVDPAVIWTIQGPVIDFQEDLPGFIDQAMNQFRQDFLPMEPTSFQPPEMVLIGGRSEIQLDRQDRVIPSAEATGFWFKLAAAAGVPNIIETQAPVFAANEIISRSDLEVPTRLDLEGVLRATGETQTVDLKETKIATVTPVTVTIFETPVIKPMVVNLEPEERLKSSVQATTKQHLNDTVVEARRGGTPTRLDLEGVEGKEAGPVKKIDTLLHDRTEKCQELMTDSEASGVEGATTKQHLNDTVVEARRGGTPTRLDLEGVEGANDIQKVVFSADNRKTAALKISGTIPIYKIKWPLLKPIKDIPEWIWQGTGVDPEEIIDWSWFLVTMFYALLNTKELLKVKRS